MTLWWLGPIHARIIGSDSSTKVTGNLPARDAAEIRRVVHHDIWRELLPHVPQSNLSLRWLTWYIGQLPSRIQSLTREPERIDEITVNPDGSVTVRTYKPWRLKVGSRIEDWGCSGGHYIMKKGPKEWQIVSKGWWQS
jgi:hypothetical protein